MPTADEVTDHFANNPRIQAKQAAIAEGDYVGTVLTPEDWERLVGARLLVAEPTDFSGCRKKRNAAREARDERAEKLNAAAGRGRVNGKERQKMPVEVLDEDGKIVGVEMVATGVRGRGRNGSWRKPRAQ